jgi:ADP-ribosyl-[dinitrogen reductase] hydrolase
VYLRLALTPIRKGNCLALTREARIHGCLLGGALGDAIGSHFEGSPVVSDFALPSDLRVTDDTQLTLATCEAIVDSCSVTPELIARQFVKWFRERRITGIGSSTLKALTELDAGGHWALVGATGERAAGNGAAMRIAPLAFFLDPDIDTHRQTFRDVCRITHRNDEAYIGALALFRTVHFCMQGGHLNAGVFTSLIESLPDSNVRDRLKACRDHAITVADYGKQFATTGYVTDSVPLAILAAVRATEFMTSTEELVRLGGDTDSIASMFGQIYGAAHGVESLPLPLLDLMDSVALVRKLAMSLLQIRIVT